MKAIMRYRFILALICILVAASLVVVHSKPEPRIISQALADEGAALKDVLAAAENFEPVKSEKGIVYYKAYNKDNKFIGVAFKTQSKGYSSIIEAMVGMTKDGTITAIKILKQNETAGVGARVVEPSFTGQFSNKNVQNLNEVQAITGATVSSGAVIDAVTQKAKEIKELIKDEK
jgi:electron transport complex protein RnfG